MPVRRLYRLFRCIFMVNDVPRGVFSDAICLFLIKSGPQDYSYGVLGFWGFGVLG